MQFFSKDNQSKDNQVLMRIENTQKLHTLYLKVLLKIGIKLMSQLSDAIDRAEAEALVDANANSAVLGLLTALTNQLAEALANGTPAEQVARIDAITSAWAARNAEMTAAALAGTGAGEPV
jgi:hypothetical protein